MYLFEQHRSSVSEPRVYLNEVCTCTQRRQGVISAHDTANPDYGEAGAQFRAQLRNHPHREGMQRRAAQAARLCCSRRGSQGRGAR